jgi:sigma-E factor negative regulatory protein RseA
MMQVDQMNKNGTDERGELLSALADGELGRAEYAQWMATPAEADADMATTWAAYHVIGDVLRGADPLVAQSPSGFVQRLQLRLQDEAPLAPERPQAMAAALPVAGHAEPANDAVFRWKLVAGVASISAVAVLTWGMAGGGAGPAGVAPQLAVAPAAPVVSQTVEQPVRLAGGEEQIMIRDPRLDELLAQHRQGGTTALSLPGGVLRSTTFASPER